jgi:hypothetical protein
VPSALPLVDWSRRGGQSSNWIDRHGA